MNTFQKKLNAWMAENDIEDVEQLDYTFSDGKSDLVNELLAEEEPDLYDELRSYALSTNEHLGTQIDEAIFEELLHGGALQSALKKPDDWRWKDIEERSKGKPHEDLSLKDKADIFNDMFMFGSVIPADLILSTIDESPELRQQVKQAVVDRFFETAQEKHKQAIDRDGTHTHKQAITRD